MITLAQVTTAMPSVVSYETNVITPTIAQVVSLFEERTNRLWTRRVDHQEVQRVQPFRRYGMIFLDLYPIEEIELDGWNDDQIESDAVPIDSTTVRVDKEVGTLVTNNGEPWPDYVRATITGGYDTDTHRVAASVQQALVDQVVYHLTRNLQNANAGSLSTPNGGKSLRDSPYSALFENAVKFHMRKAGH